MVYALAFHHLPPAVAYRAIAEATRVGRRFLVIDLERASPLGMLLGPFVIGATSFSMMPLSSLLPTMHDGLISALRAYSREALVALGKAADPATNVDFRPPPASQGGLAPLVAVFSRPGVAALPGQSFE